MTNYHFKCTLCGDELDPKTTRYVCPKHGDDGILDTIFDYKEIASRASPATILGSTD